MTPEALLEHHLSEMEAELRMHGNGLQRIKALAFDLKMKEGQPYDLLGRIERMTEMAMRMAAMAHTEVELSRRDRAKAAREFDAAMAHKRGEV